MAFHLIFSMPTVDGRQQTQPHERFCGLEGGGRIRDTRGKYNAFSLRNETLRGMDRYDMERFLVGSRQIDAKALQIVYSEKEMCHAIHSPRQPLDLIYTSFPLPFSSPTPYPLPKPHCLAPSSLLTLKNANLANLPKLAQKCLPAACSMILSSNLTTPTRTSCRG